MSKGKVYTTVVFNCSSCPNCIRVKDPISSPKCLALRRTIEGMDNVDDDKCRIPEWCPLPNAKEYYNG